MSFFSLNPLLLYFGDSIYFFFELFLFVGSFVLFGFCVFLNNQQSFFFSKVVVPFCSLLIGLCVLSCEFLVINFGYSFSLFNTQYVIDNSISIFKLILISFFGLVLFLLYHFLLRDHITFEYLYICLLSIFGGLILLSANDFVLVYLGLELQTFAFFILISLEINKSVSVEASLKYFLLSAIMSGFYLIGVVFLYIFFGFVNFLDIFDFFFNCQYIHESYPSAFIGVIFLFVVFLFKLTLAPFHTWAPDVYEGTSLFTLLILTVLPKLSIFLVFFKLIIYCFSIFSLFAIYFIIIIFVSLFIGGIGAIYEDKVKRILAFSGIVNSSLLFSCCLFYSFDSMNNVYLFCFIYFLSMLAFFSVFLSLRGNVNNLILRNIEYLSSLFFSNTPLCLCLCVFFFFFVGLPPFLGFITKFYLFYFFSIIWTFMGVLLMLLINLISYYFYVRFIRLFVFFNLNQFYSFFFYLTLPRSNSYLFMTILVYQVIVLFFFDVNILMDNTLWYF